MMCWLGQGELALVTTISAILSALLSIVVKLAIVERLATNTGLEETSPPPNSVDEQTASPPPEPHPDGETASHET